MAAYCAVVGRGKGISLNTLRNLLNIDDTTFAFAKGVGGAFITRGIGIVVNALVHLVLARWMGAQEYGIFALAIAWLFVAVSFARMGLDTASLRFVASYDVRRDQRHMQAFFRSSRLFVLIGGVSVSATALMIAVLLRERMSPEMFATLCIGFASITLLSQVHLVQAWLRGLRRVVLSQLPDPLSRSLLLGVFAWGFFYHRGELKGPMAMTLNFVATTIILFGAYAMFFKLYPISLTRGKTLGKIKLWLRVALPMFLMTEIQVINNQMDMIMVGFFLGAGQVGPYAAAIKITTFVLFIRMAADTILAPMVSRFYASGDMEKLQRWVILDCRTMLAFSVPIAALLCFGGKWILSLFGGEFIVAYKVLAVLAVAQVIRAFGGSGGYLLMMTGRQNIMAFLLAVVVVINVLFNAALIPVLGLTGAAIAAGATILLYNLSLVILSKRYLGIRISVFS